MFLYLRRIAAFVVDWNLCLLPAIFLSFYAEHRFIYSSAPFNKRLVIYALPFLIALIGIVFFLFRDVVCGGRSIGKRLFRIAVVDCQTWSVPSVSRRLLRALFFCIYPAEGISLLCSGRTIGDRVTKTIGVTMKALRSVQNRLPPDELSS